MADSLTSITRTSRADIEGYLGLANSGDVARPPPRRWPAPPIVALLFFEASTRTRVGFETATYRLGGQAVVVNEAKYHDRMSGAESLEDTVRCIQAYSDVLCLRHPDDGALVRLMPILNKPVVNCGNGFDEHPTQALIDLMTIHNSLGRLDNLTVALVGDLRYARAAHSLVLGLSRFDGVMVKAASPRQLRLPDRYRLPYEGSGNRYLEREDMDLSDVDVVYVTGFPPRLPAGEFSQAVRDRYKITAQTARLLRPEAIILCPLPRIDEIDTDVDALPQARYFQQSENGLAMRMAVLSRLFG